MKTIIDSDRQISLYAPICNGQTFIEMVAEAERVYQCGRRARRNGCRRVLANPSSKAELGRWYRGWDDADRELKAEQCCQ